MCDDSDAQSRSATPVDDSGAGGGRKSRSNAASAAASAPKQLSFKQILEQRHSDRLREKYGLTTFNDLEALPEEGIEWDQIRPDDRVAMKSFHEKKEQDLMEAIAELQHSTAVLPLGRDRTFRRYWVFQSVAGVFVEDDEDEEMVPSSYFDDLVEQQPEVVPDTPLTTNTAADGASGSTVTKNNTSSVNQESQNKTETDAKPPLPNGVASNDVKEESANQPCVLTNGLKVKEETDQDSDVIMLDDSSARSTPVQAEEEVTKPFQTVAQQISERGRVRWSYYSSIAELDSLIARLNPRGFREGPLRLALKEQRRFIERRLQHCPLHLLNLSAQERSDTRKRFAKVKSRRRMRHGQVTDASASELMELNLREQLLDLEERIFVGTLGRLLVNNRMRWREAIEGGSYDPQCDTLTWCNKSEDVAERFAAKQKEWQALQ